MLDKITKSATVVFLFLLPLFTLVIPNTSVDSDKQVLLVFFTGLFFVVYTLKIAMEKKISLVRTPVDYLLLIIAIIAVISTFLFSPNKIASITSAYGVITLVSLFLLYFTLSQTSNLQHPTINHLYPLIASSVIVAFLSLLNQFKILTNVLPLGGSLATFSFLLLVDIFLVAKLIHTKFSPAAKEKKQGMGKNLNVEDLLQIAALVVISLSVAVLGYHLFTDQQPLLLPFNFGWIIMMEMFKNFYNFLLGIGPNNFGIAYTLGKPAAINQTPFWNLTATSSTSYFLTLATELGIIASLSALFILGKTIRFRSHTHYQNASYPYLIALIAALILIFVIPASVASLSLTVILLAIASPKWKSREITLPSVSPYLLVGVILLLVVGLYWQGKFYLADISFRRAIAAANSQKLNDAFNLTQQAIRLNPNSENYYSLSSSLSLANAQALLQNSKDKNSTESARQASLLTQQALADARTAVQLNGLNSQSWGQLAGVYQAVTGALQGQNEQQQQAAQAALDAYNRQIALDATSPVARIQAGGFLMALGQANQALNLFTQAVNLKPDWNAAHYNLATLLVQAQQYKDAAVELQRTLDLTPSNSEDYKKLQEELEQVKKLIPPEATPSAGTSGQAPSGTTNQPGSGGPARPQPAQTNQGNVSPTAKPAKPATKQSTPSSQQPPPTQE